MIPCKAARSARLFLTIAFAALPFAAPVFSLDIQAQIDKNQMTLDEDINVTIQVTGEDVKENPAFPEFVENADFKFINKNSFQSSSQNITVINGKFSRSVVKTITYQFTFKPARIGELLLPTFTFKYRDFSRTFAGTKIQVLKESPESSDLDFYFLFKKQSLYVNEQTLLTAVIRIKANSMVRQVQPPDIEKVLSRYFWMKPVTGKYAESMENVNGVQHKVYRLDYVAFPIMAGQVKVPSVALQYTVLERSQARRRDQFFDDALFNQFFNGGTTKSKTKYSRPITINVRELPDKGKPPNCEGAVGAFGISASTDKREVKAGEAINLKVVVTGKGNEKSVGSVRISNMDKFEVFDPEISSSTDIKNSNVYVTKTFKYVLIPQYEGAYDLEPSLFFFDPDKGAYDSAKTAVELIVLKGAASKQAGGSGRYLSKEEIKMVGKDIQYIKTEAASITDESKRFYKEPLFAFLAVFPFLFAGVFAIVRRQKVRMETDIEYARLKKAKKKASKMLSAASKQIAHSAGGEFYATINKSLTGYIADKLNIAAAGLTNDAIHDALTGRKVSNELIQDVTRFFEECDIYRFGSMGTAEKDRRGNYERAEALITRLEKELR